MRWTSKVLEIYAIVGIVLNKLTFWTLAFIVYHYLSSFYAIACPTFYLYSKYKFLYFFKIFLYLFIFCKPDSSYPSAGQ